MAAELKSIQLSIREIKEAEAPVDLAVAISLMGAIDEEICYMAIFHLEREIKLTLKLALQSLKPVEQSLKDKDEAKRQDEGRLDLVQRDTLSCLWKYLAAKVQSILNLICVFTFNNQYLESRPNFYHHQRTDLFFKSNDISILAPLLLVPST